MNPSPKEMPMDYSAMLNSGDVSSPDVDDRKPSAFKDVAVTASVMEEVAVELADELSKQERPTEKNEEDQVEERKAIMSNVPQRTILR